MAKRYQNKDWKRAMTIRLDYNNMMREFIGDEGITREELVAYRKSADKALGKAAKTIHMKRTSAKNLVFCYSSYFIT